MSAPAAARSRGPEDHSCHVWPVPGTSLPAETTACVLSIMGVAEECEAQKQQQSVPAFMLGKSLFVPLQPRTNIPALAKSSKH